MAISRYWTALVVVLLAQSVMAHMGLLYPMARGSVGDKKQYDGQPHAFIGYSKKRTLPCNGYNQVGPITKLRAGQIVNTRFWGPALESKYNDRLPKKPSPGGKQINQARHGGGFCQYSLSYDGGKTFHLIAEYHQSCPDFYYEWPVKIPSNAPSCREKGKCLFVWSWIAVNVPQFYINCADVVIDGVDNGKWKTNKGIQIVDAPGHPKGVTKPGDDAGDKMGKGPRSEDVKKNLMDNWN
ncbi:hypothetical protein BGX29_000489 [Mortierella sp. GBA35]|nr:hypothetical protein BGX23_000259 [Mortierella sp. AD031]KAF9088050.1 hypothetical protein BGX29_000489 [Mortierella sp. GBA35]KAG0217137.1 hypothetical protein BGX33_011340 [Mortierella sp. NVP41]